MITVNDAGNCWLFKKPSRVAACLALGSSLLLPVAGGEDKPNHPDKTTQHKTTQHKTHGVTQPAAQPATAAHRSAGPQAHHPNPPKPTGKCQVQRYGKGSLRFNCPDGRSGYAIPTFQGHMFVVRRDPTGKVTAYSVEQRAKGGYAADEISLTKACKTPRDDCRLQYYYSTLGPNEEPADWAARLAALPYCPGVQEDFQCGPLGDSDTCPVYERYCRYVPFFSEITCPAAQVCNAF